MNCDKFEKLFIQESEDELLVHIQNCKHCMAEYNKMLITEKLIKEAKPYFKQKKLMQNFAVKAAASFALFIFSFTFFFQNNATCSLVTKISYDDAVSAKYQTDEYGLLDIQ